MPSLTLELPAQSPRQAPAWPALSSFSRTCSITAMIILVHAGLIWLMGKALTSPVALFDTPTVMMGTVEPDTPAATNPAPEATPKAVRPPTRPLVPLVPQPTQRSTPLSSKTSTTPRDTPAAPASEQTATSAAPATGQVEATPSPLQASGDPRASATPAAAPVTLPSSDADYLNNPAPVYPRLSRRLGEQGTVIIRVLINIDGRPEKAEIRGPSGYPRLDEVALDTVERWRFVPGKRAGAPTAMWFNVPIRFVLD